MDITENKTFYDCELLFRDKNDIRQLIARMIRNCHDKRREKYGDEIPFELYIKIGKYAFNKADFIDGQDIMYTIDVDDRCFAIFIRKDNIRIVDSCNASNQISIILHVEEPAIEYDKKLREYFLRDVQVTSEIFKHVEKMNYKYCLNIKKVIFHKPATIVYWDDGSKTVVKVNKGERWDKEKGLAMAIIKKKFGLKEFLEKCNE